MSGYTRITRGKGARARGEEESYARDILEAVVPDMLDVAENSLQYFLQYWAASSTSSKAYYCHLLKASLDAHIAVKLHDQEDHLKGGIVHITINNTSKFDGSHQSP